MKADVVDNSLRRSRETTVYLVDARTLLSSSLNRSNFSSTKRLRAYIALSVTFRNLKICNSIDGYMQQSSIKPRVLADPKRVLVSISIYFSRREVR